MSLRDNLKNWAKDYCNCDFKDKNGNEAIPGGVELFLDRAEAYLEKEEGITSETLGDHSISYDLKLPWDVTRFLHPYRKVGF